MSGPLKGIRIIEFAGIGPGPFCGMMLADHGAEVIRIDRNTGPNRTIGALSRSRKSIVLNLKSPDGVALARRLVKSADGLIEGFRPGVMERLQLGPNVLLQDNPGLVYGRMTGWGQDGPYAQAAGHDINYIALSGVLHTCGRAGEKPTPPVNYLGDFGGGGMMLAFGMVSALLAVKNGAAGQVVDASMSDGSALLSAMTWGFLEAGAWEDERGVNRLDTGAPYYDVYETKDGKYVSVGAIEPQFYQLLGELTGLKDDEDFIRQNDRGRWPAIRKKLTSVFKEKIRDEWCTVFEGSDACFAPVLSLREAAMHPHNIARKTFATVDGKTQPAPAPRFSGNEHDASRPAPSNGADTRSVLIGLGYSEEEIENWRESGAIQECP
ncbi:CaiB/BaiF CoA transferase family protein [Eilatimonas milleporae]|uniref:Alpha-methylacyl-CoA racemase n=1 Tax=Eilatimonas milleporae TaxID=911205 RepID=A0A3M0C8R6_9PROT|nr:CaiB/BaiF CoA-transferase family protein [Eilatimonas milleporae]RMB04750.1 alpha-methylacyl-CoA racemase [Eilatimonas milleporae]